MNPLPQERLIERVRERCLADERIEAALMYGSFAQGAGDEYSDIEFWLFAAPGQELDPHKWIGQVAPVEHLVVNEFGTHVAFFPGLIRGEFHFASADDIGSVGAWPARGAATAIVDRTGVLTTALDTLPQSPQLPSTPEEIDTLCGRFANWLLLAHHVARRGEHLRALDALAHARRHLLWLARLATDSTTHWLTPSRAAELELPAEAVTAISATTTTADPAELDAAVRAAWICGRGYWRQLADRHGFPVPTELFAALDQATGVG